MKKNSLVVLALLASTAPAATQPGDPLAGEDAYIEVCAECHASAARIVRKIRRDSAEEMSAWLEDFLDDHHLGDTERKADLIAFLVGL